MHHPEYQIASPSCPLTTQRCLRWQVGHHALPHGLATIPSLQQVPMLLGQHYQEPVRRVEYWDLVWRREFTSLSCLKEGPGGPGGPGGPRTPTPGSPWDIRRICHTEDTEDTWSPLSVRSWDRKGAMLWSAHTYLLTLGAHFSWGSWKALRPSVTLEDKDRS